ncbi:MAG: restriction endonuclease subunit S [Bacteroidaceae bacterium]|nr:restriction endonuclease subunit S [Bacteroidaceae bacterium]
MKQGWTYKKFTDVCDVQYGYAFDSKCFTDDESAMPLIRIRDVMRGYSETFYNGDIPEGYAINEGDYLVGMDGEFNIGRWGKRPGLLNQRVCKMATSSPLLYNQYMYYFMKVCLKSIEDETPFVTVKHLSAKRINQIQIPLPPLSVQQSIVAELDEINHLLSLKRKQLETYDKLAQSLFYEMFGDPVENEKGWEVKKLGEVCEKITDGTHKTPSYKESGVVFLSAKNVKNGYFNYDDCKYIGEDEFVELDKRCDPRKGDIVITKSGSIGDCAILNAPFNVAFFESLALLKLRREVESQYIKAFIRNKQVQSEYIYDKIKGIAIKHLHLTELKAMLIPLPPLPLQQQFAQRIEAIEAQKANVKAAIEKLGTLLAARMQYWFE